MKVSPHFFGGKKIMSTLTVVIKTNKKVADFKKTGQTTANLSRIVNLLSGLKSGVLQGAVTLTSSTANPVAAAATATITYADIANNDTITILGVTLTCVTGTPTTDQFKKETNASTTATNLATAVNANSTLAKHVYATASSGVVTLTVNQKGSIGNFLEDITKSSTGIALVQWTGGTGGTESTAVSIGR